MRRMRPQFDGAADDGGLSGVAVNGGMREVLDPLLIYWGSLTCEIGRRNSIATHTGIYVAATQTIK